jgi:hypothetical protein
MSEMMLPRQLNFQSESSAVSQQSEITKFLYDFFLSCIIEETYVKLQLKLVAKITTNYGSKGFV